MKWDRIASIGYLSRLRLKRMGGTPNTLLIYGSCYPEGDGDIVYMLGENQRRPRDGFAVLW